MLRILLLSTILAANVQGFAPAPSQLRRLPQSFVLAVKTQPNMIVVTSTATEHKNLAIQDRNGRQSVPVVPHFTATSDETIVCDLTGLCIEARGDKDGDAVGVSQCTGERHQLWEVLPTNQIQLKGTNKCLNVAKEEINPSEILIKLRHCDVTVTEWKFESEYPSCTFFSRHAMIVCPILVGFAALSLSAWLQKRATAMNEGVAPLPVNQGGVCLIEPAAISLNPTIITAPSRCTPMSRQFLDPMSSFVLYLGGVGATNWRTPSSRIVLEPDYGFATGSAALSAAGLAAGIPLAGVPFGLLGALLAVRARVVRFVFDPDAFEVIEVDGDAEAKDEQREHFRVGGANRWNYKSVTEWAMYPSLENPLFVYFRETQTRPEGQGHLFPMLCQPQRLREVMVDRIGEDKRVTTFPNLE